MIIPVVCHTCNHKLADKWELFKKLRKEKEATDKKACKKILDNLGLMSPCCRTVFLTAVELYKIV